MGRFRGMEKSEIINKDIMEKGNEEYVIVLHGSSQEDENFANHAVQRVEEIFRENNSNLKVFLPKRDLAGVSNRDKVIDIVANNSKKIIVIFSSTLFDSIEKSWKFYLYRKFAKSMDEDEVCVLPVLYEPCEIPSPFNNLHFCYYATDKISPNFWVKLMSAFEINVLSPEFKKLGFERITPHQIDVKTVKTKNHLLQNESDQWSSMESLKKTNT